MPHRLVHVSTSPARPLDSDEKAEAQALLQGAESLAYLLEDLPRRLRA
ncbi:hypothetical protein ACIGXF_15980 [Streptomyces sp. NPDC053086]